MPFLHESPSETAGTWFADASLMELLASLREQRRIARHIRRARSAAHKRDLSGLTRVQRMIRELLLGEVAAYVEDGRFPKNREFPWKMPVFVDDQGTRCAMAHLMEV